MTLHIGGLGTVKPHFKFNAKADKWFVRGADGVDQEMVRPTFVADLDNIATGWLLFREGQAPERIIDTSLSSPAPIPGEGYKRGFVLMAYSPKFFGGAAEFSSASTHVANAIRELYGEYEAERSAHRGQLPVIACTGSQAMRDKHGTNYRPIFKISQWVDRPADLPDRSPVEPSEVWQGQAAPAQTVRTPAQHVPPPPPKAAVDEALF